MKRVLCAALFWSAIIVLMWFNAVYDDVPVIALPSI